MQVSNSFYVLTHTTPGLDNKANFVFSDPRQKPMARAVDSSRPDNFIGLILPNMNEGLPLMFS